MTQRGRKSKSSSLTIVPPVEPLPPEPHPSMSPAAVEVWNEVLGAVHHGFRGCEFLLESLCWTISLERQFARDVETLPPGPARTEAAKARRAEANLAAMLATKLRAQPAIEGRQAHPAAHDSARQEAVGASGRRRRRRGLTRKGPARGDSGAE